MNVFTPFKAAGAAALALALVLTPVSMFLANAVSPVSAASSEQSASELTLASAPVKKNGVFFVPVKELTSYTNLHITRAQDKKTFYLSSPLQSVTLQLGSYKASDAKGNTIALQGAPFVRQGVTYVPASLLSKSFGIDIVSKGKSAVTITSLPKDYVPAASGTMLFWINRNTGELITGQAGSMPRPAGKINIDNIDWIILQGRKVNASTYVVDIHNAYGEPHVHENRVRALIHDGKIVKQGLTQYSNFAGMKTKPSVSGYKGHIPIIDGSILQLVHPTGKVVKTYDLAAITGVQDDFVVEVIEADFLLVRPLTKATLFIVHPTAKTSVLIYPELLDEETVNFINDYPSNELGYTGDGLEYKGYQNRTLTLTWTLPVLSSIKTYTYELPF